jgi:hypothetical protein
MDKTSEGEGNEGSSETAAENSCLRGYPKRRIQSPTRQQGNLARVLLQSPLRQQGFFFKARRASKGSVQNRESRSHAPGMLGVEETLARAAGFENNPCSRGGL